MERNVLEDLFVEIPEKDMKLLERIDRSNVGYGYAWQLENGEICHWALSRKNKSDPPSSGAKLISVAIISRGDLYLLRRMVSEYIIAKSQAREPNQPKER